MHQYCSLASRRRSPLYISASLSFPRAFVILAGLLILFSICASNRSYALQPSNSSQLNGTWVNTQSSGLIAQVDIIGVADTFEVHPYGFCSPTLCDWGSQPAYRFSGSVTSNNAIGFQLTSGASTDTKFIQGHLTGAGTLEITTQIKFPQGSPNNNYEVTEEFQLGTTGAQPPANGSGLFGNWTIIKSDGGLAQVIIGESGGTLDVHAYGTCSPTDCDWGTQSGSQFSASTAASTPIGFQATYQFSFASAYLQGHLISSSTGETLLEITTQTTFATRDPRYDFEQTEEFQLSSASPASFSLTSASAALTVASGGQATDIITITPVNGSWDTAVQLSCNVTGSSPMPTCSLSNPSVTPGSTPVTSTLTVSMPNVAATTPMKRKNWMQYAVLAPFAFGLALAGSWKKRWRYSQLLGAIAVLSVLSLSELACSGSSMTNSAAVKPPSPYFVNVTAISGTVQQSSEITLTLQ
jgi:hypothetical protein